MDQFSFTSSFASPVKKLKVNLPSDKYIYKYQRFTGSSKAPRESWAIWAYDTYHTSWNNELRNLGHKAGASIVSCVFQCVFSISHILCCIYALLLWDRLVLKSLSLVHGTLGGAGIFENWVLEEGLLIKDKPWRRTLLSFLLSSCHDISNFSHRRFMMHYSLSTDPVDLGSKSPILSQNISPNSFVET